MKSRNDFPTEAEYLEYLRHYYAGQALEGMLARRYDDGGEDIDDTCISAVEYADRLVLELQITSKPIKKKPLKQHPRT